MSVKAVTYYTVECDAPGCGKTLGDLGHDYSAWADEWAAREEWAEAEGVIDELGRALCPKHAEDYRWCDQCDDKRTFRVDTDGDPICDDCATEVGS